MAFNDIANCPIVMTGLYVKGRTFFELPTSLFCPDCQSSFMAIGSISGNTAKKGGSTDGFVEMIRSRFPDCSNHFHVYFLAVENYDPKLVNSLPENFRKSHPGLEKGHMDDQHVRADMMAKFLQSMRDNLIFPLIDGLQPDDDLDFSIAPRHQLFQLACGVIRTPEKNSPTERDLEQERITAIPLLPAYLEDMSNWVVLLGHFQLVFQELYRVLEGMENSNAYSMRLFFGSTNLPLLVCSLFLNFPYDSEPIKRDLRVDLDPNLGEWIRTTEFYFGLYDPKMETEKSQPTLDGQGYHLTPANEVAWEGWFDS